MAEREREEKRGRREGRDSSPPHRDDERRDGSLQHRRKTCSLLVRNLSYNVRQDEIKRIFTRYGDIRDVHISIDYYTKKSRGIAFVEFFDKCDATAALDNLDHYELGGRYISVLFAKDHRKSFNEMSPRGIGDKSRCHSRSRSRDRRDHRSPRHGRPARRSVTPARHTNDRSPACSLVSSISKK